MTLGEKIKAGRKRIGITQEQLAEQLYVSRQAIQKWESDGGIPSIENLKAISQLFGVSIDSLVADDAPHQTEKEPAPAARKVEPRRREELSKRAIKVCPNCGAEFMQEVNFCNRCGYSFGGGPEAPAAQGEAVQSEPAKQRGGAGKWLRENLKWLLPLVIGFVVIIVLCALIPTFISLSKSVSKLNGTYYLRSENDKSNYLELKDGKWEMGGTTSTSGRYKKSGTEIFLYYEDETLFYGTVNKDLLTLKNVQSDTEISYLKEGHVHRFGEWISEPPSEDWEGDWYLEYRYCYCGGAEVRWKE